MNKNNLIKIIALYLFSQVFYKVECGATSTSSTNIELLSKAFPNQINNNAIKRIKYDIFFNLKFKKGQS